MAGEGEDGAAGDVGTEDFPGRMLHQAAIYNNVDFLADLLEGEEAANINAQDSYGRSALYTAVTNNSLECARMLLQYGANPNVACGPRCGRMTPLHAAALDDKHAFLHLLLREGADLNVSDASGEKPLDLAVKNRSEECVHIIVKEIERRETAKSDQDKGFMEACMLLQVDKAKELAQQLSSDDIRRIINTAQDTQTSILHSACETGDAAMAKFLLENGAECKVHPVTGNSPLHAACQAGHASTVKTVLQSFPELVQFSTIEGTLPLHIAAAEGHANVINVILNFPYPSKNRQIYRDEGKDHFYKLGFPINAKDGRGHSLLHLACLNNRQDVVVQLLNFHVKIVKRENLNTSNEEEEEEEEEEADMVDGNAQFFGSRLEVEELPEVVPPSPDAREATEDLYSPGTAAVAAQVAAAAAATVPMPPKHDMFCPVDIDSLDLDGCTPLHLAVKGNGQRGYHQVAQVLLQHGANPNKPIISPSGNSTALMEACVVGDVAMMDLLLKHKAQDTELKVLSAACISQDSSMAATLLKYKSYKDSEYKINKQAVILYHFGQMQGMADTYDATSHVFPTTPTTINWHALNLPNVDLCWLQEASLLRNPHIACQENHFQLAMFAITRIDVSKNNLQSLPKEMFTLKSLRLLNISENKLLCLPGDTSREDCALVPVGSSSSGNGSPVNGYKPTEVFSWELPFLEEVQCYKNKLRTVPAGLFTLPSLKRLNLSQNDLERLPFEMWRAPALLELNLSHNHLRELPLGMNYTHQMASLDGTSMDGLTDVSTLEDSGNHGGSVPTTPKKLSTTSTSNTSSHGSSSGTSERDASYPLDELLSPGATTPVRPYTEQEVEQVSLWKDRLRIRAAIGVMEPLEHTKGSVSVLQELNLSHNLFDSVPPGLPCLVPSLNKLVLTHNRLTHVGALCTYPASLKMLDLSYNNIFQHVLFECALFDEEHPVERWAARPCYNPSPRKQRHSSTSSARSTITSGSITPASGLSVPSTPAARSNGVSCSHRSHLVLEQLKTLKLDHNKLCTITLVVDSAENSSDSTSDDLPRSPSRTSLRHMSMTSESSSSTTTGGTGRTNLLYPELTVLDASHNQLSSLPAEISEMTGLTELKLGHNKLKELPPELGLLRKLWNLDVSGCPVERSLQSLLGDKAKKTAAVLSYLKSIKDEATLYNRMKLMFVGIQGIGKTSLLAQLRKEGRSTSIKHNKNWAQRMGHGSIKDKDLKGENISTVGVDIGDLILQRGSKEIIFSTWDFGGQKEYYATHQYFLSKRSLYLVCWKVTDGERGVIDIMQWLVNIQARAPNSPVIIVGTHLDQINKRRYPPTYLEDLQNLIENRYMKLTEPEKWGLPRVIGHVEVSCKPSIMSRSHISELVHLIYRVAFEEQWPGSKGVKLVEQKVPASYVHLQDVVRDISEERKAQGKDPVLHTEQYRMLVMGRMEALHKTSFRDIAELNQATQFLHENGVLLHYDDVSLQDVYFLDPQWLCDMMANVVTIREINSLAKSGIMRTEDLRLQFKNAAFKPEDIRSYIIDLLNKFEVALLWDDQNLLIPSLLPAEEDLKHNRPYSDIRIPVRGCQLAEQRPHYGKGDKSKGPPVAPPREEGRSTFYIESPAFPMDEDALAKESVEDGCRPHVTNNTNPAVALVRLYLMSYFPSGFWPRLITRLLGDNTLYSLVLSLYDLPDVLVMDEHFMRTTGSCPEWKCWQSGVELRYMDVVLARLKEVPRDSPNRFCDYRQCEMVMRREEMEGGVAVLNLNSTAILEILFPNESITVGFDSICENEGINETIVIQPSPQVTAGLLAKIVDHVDTLLEDWYPDLGARFIQNSRGMYLITRVVPCTRCVLQQKEAQAKRVASKEAWSMVDVNPSDKNACITEPIVIDRNKAQQAEEAVEEGSLDELPPSDQVQSQSAPVGPGSETWVDSMYSSGFKVVQTVGTLYNKTADATGVLPRLNRCGEGGSEGAGTGVGERIYCYLVEQCLQAAQQNKVVFCPVHGNMGPYFIASREGHVTSAHAAPDSVFQDIGDQYHIDPDQIWLGQILGRGAFGAVFAGSMVDKRSGEMIDIAMKMLQPVDPGQTATPSQKQQYNAERQRWEKDPMKNACEAYLNARKELSILLSLHHTHIVPLLGVALQPLCLVLSLAPKGALSSCLREFRRAGARLPISVIQATIVQVASALSYLHCCQIIYRDLKSENVLVWDLPAPGATVAASPVNVKLADYGVSRAVLPSGAKGFAGTPPFIAPEIIQHNGEESYTEKVDCFSFGMFIYELLMLRHPFEDGDSGAAAVANLKGHILAGGRPPITFKELNYPNHVLDLMTLCWSHDPGDRPSAEQIRSIAETTEFVGLKDAVALGTDCDPVCACTTASPYDISLLTDTYGDGYESTPCSDVWTSVKTTNETGRVSVHTYHDQRCIQKKSVKIDGASQIMCMCRAGQYIWLADSAGIIHIFRHSDYTEVLKFPVTTTPNVHVRTMVFGTCESHVFVVMDTGRLVVCGTSLPSNLSSTYTPVRTECPGNGKPIHCLSALPSSKGSSELWCGQARGQIRVWNLHTTSGGMRVLNHPEISSDSATVVHIVTDSTPFNVTESNPKPPQPSSVWSYVYPGTEVYRWDVHTQSVQGRLDVSTVLPKHDPYIYPLLEGHHITAPKCQVTAMCAIDKELFIGTTLGCVIVADSASMLPLKACRCHSDTMPYVTTIIPLLSMCTDSDTENPTQTLTCTGLVSFGKGYNNVIASKMASATVRTDLNQESTLLSWTIGTWDFDHQAVPPVGTSL